MEAGSLSKPNEPHVRVMVESYRDSHTAGLHGEVHVRPVAGQGFPTNMNVRCPHELKRNYPVGTRFWIRAKVTAARRRRFPFDAPFVAVGGADRLSFRGCPDVFTPQRDQVGQRVFEDAVFLVKVRPPILGSLRIGHIKLHSLQKV